MKTARILRTSPIFKRCVKFSQQLSEKSSYYATYRKATSGGDVARNHKNSKLSELIVSAYISKLHGCLIAPDFNIYEENDKSWVADLPYKDQGFDVFPYNVHVKSTDNVALNRVGQKSWVFQLSNASGTGGKDDLFVHPEEHVDDWIAFCYVNEQEHYVDVSLEWFLPWKDVVDQELLKEPYYNKFKGIKLCVYENDLKELDEVRSC